MLDLRHAEVVASLDINLASLTGPRPRAHGLARRAQALGASGMIVPSAANPGEWNLVVLPAGFDRLRVSGSRATNPRPPVIAPDADT